MTDSPGARLGSGVQLQPADVVLLFGDGAPAATAAAARDAAQRFSPGRSRSWRYNHCPFFSFFHEAR